MIVAYHVSFGAYGFWLPNDPRGSWSKFVGKLELFRAAGKATTTTESRSLAYQPHDRAKRLAAKKLLQCQTVQFTDEQVVSIGRAFTDYVTKSQLCVLACAIMPDHIHVVFAAHRIDPKGIVNKLKGAATTQLVADGIHPFQHLKPTGGHRRNVSHKVNG